MIPQSAIQQRALTHPWQLDTQVEQDLLLEAVPCTTTRRGWLSEVGIAGLGVAQAHLPTTVSVDRVVERTGTNVGPVALQQIRQLTADLLGL